MNNILWGFMMKSSGVHSRGSLLTVIF